MTVFVFGNPDLPEDSLPLKILPQLRRLLPDMTFQVLDPNEEWETSEHIMVVDTVQGIRQVTVFDSLDRFIASPRVTMHDFDALSNLRYLLKLGKIKKVTVIGVPSDIPENKAASEVAARLEASRL